jgi:hypothetical protein
VEPALAYLREKGAPIVIKADGLAAPAEAQRFFRLNDSPNFFTAISLPNALTPLR